MHNIRAPLIFCPLCTWIVAHKFSSVISPEFGQEDIYKCSKCQTLTNIPMSSKLSLFMLQGLNGSGKTMYAKSITDHNPNTVRISKEDIRKELEDTGWTWNRENEVKVLFIRDSQIIEALKSGKSVVVDDTNLSPHHAHRLRTIAIEHGAVFKITFLNTPIEECIRRDSYRSEDTKVGGQVIRNMAERFHLVRGKNKVEVVIPLEPVESLVSLEPAKLLPPVTTDIERVFEPVISNDTSKLQAIICDLDAIAIKGKEESSKDFTLIHLDKVFIPVKRVLMAMHKYMGYQIVYISDRENKHRAESMRFLTANFCPVGPILMRSDNDMRKEWMVKGQLFDKFIRDKYSVPFLLTSSEDMTSFWRSIGLNVFHV